MLICPTTIDGVTEGRLIDLDYAKRTEKFIQPLLYRAKNNERAPSKKPKMLKSARATFAPCFDVEQLDNDIVDAWFNGGGDIQHFAEAVLDYNPSLRNSKV